MVAKRAGLLPFVAACRARPRLAIRRFRRIYDRGTEGQRRGCKIVVELKDDCTEFSLASKIEDILKRYSSFVQFPVNLNGKRVNTVQALWLRGKSEIKDEEYTEFYNSSQCLRHARLRCTSARTPLWRSMRCYLCRRTIGAFRPRAERTGGGAVLPQDPDRCAPRICCPNGCGLRGVVDSEDLP